jgi:mRNA interferase RelE/StbE
MSYEIRYNRGVDRDIARLPRPVMLRVDTAIMALADDPRPPKCVKLTGYSTLYRVRIGDWRVVYDVDDARQIVEVQIVAHRREVYRGL